jgi:hypothetical protein
MNVMVALTPKARALIETGRAAYRATSTDRARIEAALRTQLGAAALPSPAPAAAKSAWHFVPHIAAAACALGGAAFLALGPGATQPASSSSPVPISAPMRPSVAVVPSAEPDAVESLPLETEPAPSTRVAPGPQRAQDTLAQELALLSRATSELRAGRPAAALKSLDEHQRKFPGGALNEERRGARAQALCALGRVPEGRADLSRLPPRSPAAVRAQQVCDAAVRKP